MSAILCQTAREHPDWFTDEPPLAPAWTPQSVLMLGPTWVNVSYEAARVEFGGGFHHFGYALTISSPPTTANSETTWVLNFYSEDRADREMGRFALAPNDALSRDQFVDRTMAELDRRIAAGNDGGRNDSSVQRCKFGLKHDQIARLRADIRKTATTHSDAWRDVLLAFVIDYPSDSVRASERLRKWAENKNDFSAWLLAAYGFEKVAALDAAEDAIIQACRWPADDPAWASYHARHRSFPICYRLFVAGRFRACAPLCDTMLAYKGGGDGMHSAFVVMRDACRLALSQPSAGPPSVLPSADHSDFDPFAGLDLSRIIEPTPSTNPTATTP